MSVQLDIHRNDGTLLGRVSCDGDNYSIRSKKGMPEFKQSLHDYIENAKINGARLQDVSGSEGSAYCVSTRLIKAGDELFWEALNDDININGVIGGEQVYSIKLLIVDVDRESPADGIDPMVAGADKAEELGAFALKDCLSVTGIPVSKLVESYLIGGSKQKYELTNDEMNIVMGVGLNKVHNKSVCDECLAGVVECDDVPVG